MSDQNQPGNVPMSELQQAREALRECEEKYRSAFEYTGTAMMVINEDLTVAMGNHKIEEITGYTQEELEYRRPWTDYVHPDDRAAMLDYHRLRREEPDKVPSTYQFRMKHADGQYRDISINISMIPGSEKSLISMVDITEQKKTQAALLESRRRFQEMAELLPGIICELNTRLQFTYVNKLGLTSFGYTQEDLDRGLSAGELVHPEDRERMGQNAATILSGTLTGPNEYRFVHRDGRVVDYLLNSAPMYKGDRIVGLRTCLFDITDRKRTEEKLKESEELFRSIYSRSPIGIALFDSAGRITDTNEAFGEMFSLCGNQRNLQEGPLLFDLVPLDERSRARLDSGEGIEYESACDPAALASAGKTCEEEQQTRYLDWHITPLGGQGGPPSVLLVQVQDITERKQAEQERLRAAREEAEKANLLVESLRKEMTHSFTFSDMVSRSPHMRRIFDLLPEMAQAASTVLISGESGTGKELVAHSLHQLGPRASKPFVAINCSALPDSLLESELFGYKAGAFTDARRDKPGKFALADGGTIFLDEIGDISPAMQVKLLRVLQERTYEPLGAVRSEKVDVRVIAATNKNLSQMVKTGEFREDLYYRINVLQVKLPPLRDRRCDIPLLCDHFVDVYNTRYNKDVKSVSQEALDSLLAYDFPGNIRELENMIEHAFVFCKTDSIQPQHLPPEFRPTADGSPADALSNVKNLEDLERIYIRSILEETGGNKIAAARRLGVHKATLFRKLRKLNITTEE